MSLQPGRLGSESVDPTHGVEEAKSVWLRTATGQLLAAPPGRCRLQPLLLVLGGIETVAPFLKTEIPVIQISYHLDEFYIYLLPSPSLHTEYELLKFKSAILLRLNIFD